MVGKKSMSSCRWLEWNGDCLLSYGLRIDDDVSGPVSLEMFCYSTTGTGMFSHDLVKRISSSAVTTHIHLTSVSPTWTGKYEPSRYPSIRRVRSH